MVQDRKEPTMSTIKPERDEIASHQSRLNQRPAAGGPTRPAASRPAPAKSSSMAIFAFLLALVGIGTAAFSVWQLQAAQQSLASAGSRITELEGRLNLTSNESDQSVTKIHEKLDWADSEIRKLWGVSNDTNRKAIQANKSRLDGVDKIAKTAAADAKKAGETASSQQTTLATLRSQGNEQQLILTRADEKIDTLERQLSAVTDKSDKLEAQLSKLENLDSRVDNHEEAIKAIDSFRRTANSDIQQLKQQAGP